MQNAKSFLGFEDPSYVSSCFFCSCSLSIFVFCQRFSEALYVSIHFLRGSLLSSACRKEHNKKRKPNGGVVVVGSGTAFDAFTSVAGGIFARVRVTRQRRELLYYASEFEASRQLGLMIYKHNHVVAQFEFVEP